MTRSRLLTLVCLLLLGCTGTPTSVPSTEAPATPAVETAAPSETALPAGALPSTWTPPAVAAAQPTSTRLPPPTAAATAVSAVGSWPPGVIPPVTLTPTPADAVPEAALRAYARAQSALAAGDLDLALAQVDEALALDPGHTDFLAFRGEVLIARRLPLQGQADLRAALSYDPFNAPARRTLADLYAQYGRWRDAEAEYERYLTLAPTDPAGWFALGGARQAQGQVLSAITAYSQTLALDPAHLDGLRRRGDLWLAVEDYRAAWSDYSALLALAPSADLYQTRAAINRQLGLPLLAAADLESAISLTLPTGSPTATLMIDLGRAYLEGGAAERATAVFSATLSLVDSIEVRLLLGESYLATGVYTDALQLYAEILPLAQPVEKAAVLVGQARALLAAAEYGQAEEVLGIALDFATSLEQRAEILRWRSRAHLGAGFYPQALADLGAAEELAPHPLDRYWRGAIHEASGEADKAVVEWTAFLREADPDQVDPAVIADAEARLDALAGPP
jgi:tetratricopeptide (TPR) repeat protein